MSLEPLRDTFGNALCLSSCYQDAEPGIRCAQLIGSNQRSRRGNENAGEWGRLVKGAPFTSVRRYHGKVFSFYLYLRSRVVWGGSEHLLEPSALDNSSTIHRRYV